MDWDADNRQSQISHFFKRKVPRSDDDNTEKDSKRKCKESGDHDECRQSTNHCNLTQTFCERSDGAAAKLLQFQNCTDIGRHALAKSKDIFDSKTDKDTQVYHVDMSSKSRSKVLVKAGESKNVKVKHTPLELQFVEIKEKNPDCLLFIECGYKYRFFGDDAEIAAKELNIFCHLDHNFMTASIPTHRLNVHVSRLISKGYKVGVVRQMETAALKAAGDNKSAPFSRKLTNIYTVGTFIDGSLEGEDTGTMNTGGHLMFIFEEVTNKTNKLQPMTIMSIDLATGEVIYDSFMDGSSRFQLESRLKHIQPIEILLPQSTCALTQTFLNAYRAQCCESSLRLEYLRDELFSSKSPSENVRKEYEKLGASAETVRGVLQLDRSVLICLQAMLTYLQEFNLHKIFSLTESFKLYTNKNSYMQLCGRTLDNYIFVNNVNGKSTGTLYWLLNQTVTLFGGRLLKQWLRQPLTDLRKIDQRLGAIGEIIEEPALEKVRLVLKGLPDLERGLTMIFHGKSSPQEFLLVCQSLLKVKTFMSSSSDIAVKSELLNEIIKDLGRNLQGLEHWVKSLNPKAAKEGSKKDLFTQESGYPAVIDAKQQITDILSELQSHRRDIRLQLKAPSLEYTTVLGTEFLVEVKNTNLKLVPDDWLKMSGTKTVTRYHTPFVIEAYKRLSQQRERLEAVCEQAWQQFLRSFEEEYIKYREAVHKLASLDCLYALAQVAKEQGYCRPTLTENSGIIEIKQGRHPVVDVLLSQGSQQFVPNDTNLQPTGEQCMLITGPNMGGKSSYIKQVALISIVAQMGCFVPAESAHLSLLDAVHTRMGASDELYKGRSTFMVELSEAAEVLDKATSKSLVIMDELGRGTSTHDGVAIAYATLRHFVEKVKCLTLFVTHYPPLVEMEQMHPGIVANYHMSFYVQDSDNQDFDVENLVFLYQLVPGIAHRSYGLNVARLAGMPETILKEASVRSKQMEEKAVQKRNAENLFKKLFRGATKGMQEHLKNVLS